MLTLNLWFTKRFSRHRHALNIWDVFTYLIISIPDELRIFDYTIKTRRVELSRDIPLWLQSKISEWNTADKRRNLKSAYAFRALKIIVADRQDNAIATVQ